MEYSKPTVFQRGQILLLNQEHSESAFIHQGPMSKLLLYECSDKKSFKKALNLESVVSHSQHQISSKLDQDPPSS